MKPVEKIKIQDWMCSPQVTKVMDVLQGDTPKNKPQALFVGGCVRNSLMGFAVEDVDIATVFTPEVVMERMASAGVRVIPTGLDHGTVTVVLEGKSFEVTTLRRDDKTDGRHAIVSFTDDWLEDARRRDFTMNTLLADCEGQIFDPLGQGMEDLKARRIRFVGDPAQRIAEDHLRILRFFRFFALYGDGEPERVALAACAAAAGKIENLSRERIAQEFFKLMVSDRPADILKIMFAHGVLKDFEFKDYDADFLTHFCTFQSRYSLTALPARVFVMAGLNFENIRAMEKFVIFPKVFLKDMQAINSVLALDDLDNDHAVRVAVYKYGRTITAQSLMIELANDRVMNGYAPRALEIVQNWDVPMFPLSGDDLKKAGIKPGPEMGEILSRIEDWWIEEGFTPDREQCLNNL